MTPQNTDLIEQRTEQHLSTSDLVDAKPANGSPARPMDGKAEANNMPLFAQQDSADFRSRWDKVQTSFVDEPKAAVQEADELVASAIKKLAEGFASERERLESEWDKNDNVSTEDLRQALRRYRSFFNRVLAV